MSPVPDFVAEAIRVVEEAKRKYIVLRLIGAIVVELRCPKFESLQNTMNRPLTDIDVVTYSKSAKDLKNLFIELGYEPDERFIMLFGGSRHKYDDKVNNRYVDVFFDKIEMCHTIDLTKRLERRF